MFPLLYITRLNVICAAGLLASVHVVLDAIVPETDSSADAV